eukprot:COSAG01_NODE_6169_length_3814_cov_2.140781_1_plen_54_part_00
MMNIHRRAYTPLELGPIEEIEFLAKSELAATWQQHQLRWGLPPQQQQPCSREI